MLIAHNEVGDLNLNKEVLNCTETLCRSSLFKKDSSSKTMSARLMVTGR